MIASHEGATRLSAVAAPPKRWIAVLDDDRALVGFTETTLDKVPAGAVAFDHKPDNSCDGRYRWNDNLRRFDPIPARVLLLGDTAAFNDMVLGVLAGTVKEDKVPVEVLDTVSFIRESSPQTEDELARLVARAGGDLMKRAKARARHARDTKMKRRGKRSA